MFSCGPGRGSVSGLPVSVTGPGKTGLGLLWFTSAGTGTGKKKRVDFPLISLYEKLMLSFAGSCSKGKYFFADQKHLSLQRNKQFE